MKKLLVSSLFLIAMLLLKAFPSSAMEQQTMLINISITDISCFGGADGSASASVTGGTSPYTFNWSGGAVGSSLTNLVSGNYSLTVTDAIGLSQSSSFTINSPSAINTLFNIINASANGAADGSISTSVSGGIPPYAFSWSNGGNTANQSNLIAGSYCLTLTDANGCTDISCASVSEPPPPLANLVLTEIMYNPPELGMDTIEYIEFYNADTSAVDLTGYSFSQGVVYSFNSGIIPAGQYFVVAIDSNSFHSVFGQMPDFQWSSGTLSNGGEDIALRDNFGRRVDSVNYDDAAPWPSGGGNGQPDGGGSSIELTDYHLDNNLGINWSPSTSTSGVFVNSRQVLGSPGGPNTSVGIEKIKAVSDFNLFPNPSSGILHIQTSGQVGGELVQVYSSQGKLVYERTIDANQIQIDLGKNSEGVYLIRIKNLLKKLIISK